MISIKVDFSAAQRLALELGKQARFAAAKALTQTAVKVRDEIAKTGGVSAPHRSSHGATERQAHTAQKPEWPTPDQIARRKADLSEWKRRLHR
jgi:hypothetical protein